MKQIKKLKPKPNNQINKTNNQYKKQIMNVQNEKNLIIACTGSVATIKLPLLIEKLNALNKYKLNVIFYYNLRNTKKN